jgi:hypothetical protein
MGAVNRYRIDSEHLIQTLDNWDRLMRFRVRLIACGGSALTLMGIKDDFANLKVTHLRG